MKTRDHWQKLAMQTNDPAAWPWSGYKTFKLKASCRKAERNFIKECTCIITKFKRH